MFDCFQILPPGEGFASWEAPSARVREEGAALVVLFGRSRIGFPGGLVGGPCAYQDQFGGFKFHRVHARKDFFLQK